MVKCVGLLSFKKCSLVIGSSETCYSYTTYHYWMAGEISSFEVAIFGEGTLDKGNQFRNKISRIGPK